MLEREIEVIPEKYPLPDTIAIQDSSYAIGAVGKDPYAEVNTGDNSELVIPFNEADIISSVADRIPTLPLGWLPGTEGAGITDVIFGDKTASDMV
ncbi:hypothetical protein GH714_027686 [Hevea brasiliensis]|uniref:Uncharacterized protein n=1 Tax=Hevea brasiliensis TaxID=3981 RepID=A0A6A6KRP0_HEVBR|nr:hypothetical protein GH714_027686 [Hevea brasiliensis]